jgi:hypothetical protein
VQVVYPLRYRDIGGRLVHIIRLVSKREPRVVGRLSHVLKITYSSRSDNLLKLTEWQSYFNYWSPTYYYFNCCLLLLSSTSWSKKRVRKKFRIWWTIRFFSLSQFYIDAAMHRSEAVVVLHNNYNKFVARLAACHIDARVTRGYWSTCVQIMSSVELDPLK